MATVNRQWDAIVGISPRPLQSWRLVIGGFLALAATCAIVIVVQEHGGPKSSASTLLQLASTFASARKLAMPRTALCVSLVKLRFRTF